MNAAGRIIKRRQVIEHIEALVEWKTTTETELFKTCFHRQLLIGQISKLDTAIEVAFLELKLLAEK
jgi:hypothetical protein